MHLVLLVSDPTTHFVLAMNEYCAGQMMKADSLNGNPEGHSELVNQEIHLDLSPVQSARDQMNQSLPFCLSMCVERHSVMKSASRSRAVFMFITWSRVGEFPIPDRFPVHFSQQVWYTKELTPLYVINPFLDTDSRNLFSLAWSPTPPTIYVGCQNTSL